MQLRRSVNKRTEWTTMEKQFAVSLCYVAPKAYAFLSVTKEISLPSISSVTKWVNSLNIFTGFDDALFNRLHEKVKSMSVHEREAVLMWDEMTIKSLLEYNSKRDLIEGFEDLGHLGRKNKRAKKSLVFMIRGLIYPWKQPVAYFQIRM